MPEEQREKAPTRFPGIFIGKDSDQPFFALMVKQELDQIANTRRGRSLLAAIADAEPSVARGYKMLIVRVAMEMEAVVVESKSSNGGVRTAQPGCSRDTFPSIQSMTFHKARSFATPLQADEGVLEPDASIPGKGTSAIVGWAPNQSRRATPEDDKGRGGTKGKTGGLIQIPRWITLVHEMIHGLHFLHGTAHFGVPATQIGFAGGNVTVDREEAKTVGLDCQVGGRIYRYSKFRFTENKFREDSGLPLRATYP